jgi:hypothetical protein
MVYLYTFGIGMYIIWRTKDRWYRDRPNVVAGSRQYSDGYRDARVMPEKANGRYSAYNADTRLDRSWSDLQVQCSHILYRGLSVYQVPKILTFQFPIAEIFLISGISSSFVSAHWGHRWIGLWIWVFVLVLRVRSLFPASSVDGIVERITPSSAGFPSRNIIREDWF